MDADREPTEGRRPRRSSTLDDFVAARETTETPAPARASGDLPPEVEDEHGGLKTSCLAGVAGVCLLIVGLWLGIESYDQRFIYHDAGPIWEVLSWAGFVLVVAGALVVPISIVGAIVMGVRRMVCRARRR